MRERLTRWWASVRRGFAHAGPERDTILLIVKSALAASLAWFVANDLLGAPSATFAPFSALLMVQVTIAQSLFQSLRYAGAVIAGVVLTALLVPALGPTIAAFAVLMLAGLVIGRWRRLGSQGPQVAVAALFAYASFSQQNDVSSSLTQLTSIAALVVLGCLIGVVVNLLVVPPIRYRDGAYAVESLSRSVTELLDDMSAALVEGMPDDDRVREWSYRAERIPTLAEQARTSIEHAAETMRFNPRRLITRTGTDFSGHRVTVRALERADEQVMSMCRGLRHSKVEQRETLEVEHTFATHLAPFLGAAAQAARIIGSIHQVSDLERTSELDPPIDRGRDAVENASHYADAEELDRGRDGPIYTGLLTDARRLIEEFGQARNQLAQPGRYAVRGRTDSRSANVRPARRAPRDGGQG